MNHKEAIEVAVKAFTANYKFPLSLQIQKAVEAYLAARDCVVMPRECDDDMMNAMQLVLDEDTDPAIVHDALIAEIDRREREAGK